MTTGGSTFEKGGGMTTGSGGMGTKTGSDMGKGTSTGTTGMGGGGGRSFLDEVIDLPYERNALEPHMSEEQVTLHYEKHHKKYARTLDELAAEDTSLTKKRIIDIVMEMKGDSSSIMQKVETKEMRPYNNAAQVLNHNFFWMSLSPDGGGSPKMDKLKQAIDSCFGSLDNMKKEFNLQAMCHFGSGWVWLVRLPRSKELKIISTHDAESPLSRGMVPLLACDIWEHAYYVDYRNEKKTYLEHFWNIVNWEFVCKNLEKEE